MRPVASLYLLALSLAAAAQPALGPEERTYLASLAADTWQGIAYMADGESALPEDNTRMAGYTSVSNIGGYLASVCAAEGLGLIAPSEAHVRLARVLDACEKLNTWEGFPHSWLQTKTLAPTDERIVSSVDLGNYEAGLIVARQAHPELSGRISKLIAAMNWNALYCPGNGWLYGGWNTREGKYTDWYYLFLAADSRTASFLAIAHGVPEKHWASLQREREQVPGPAHYAPGWMGGGLFMQTLTALFINEAGTPIGRSAANFAWAQVLRGREKGLPAWGWSACVTPDGEGYIGYGKFQEEVVSPHAVALAALYFPHEAIADLRELERLGARASLLIEGKERASGFQDCMDLGTKRVPGKLLIWDQEMTLLACAALLEGDCVRTWFQADPLFAAGRDRTKDYQVSDAQREAFWQEVESLRQGQVRELRLE